MPKILKDLSQISSVFDANEANLYASTPFPYDFPEAETHRGSDISWCITGIPARACNVIFNARLNPQDVGATVKSLVRIARARNVPLRWYVGRNSRPLNLGEHLVHQGFKPDRPAPMMAIDLGTLAEDVHTASALEIVQVRDLDTLKVWSHVCSQGFGGNPQGEAAMFAWLSQAMKLGLPHRFYLALLNGEPVATSQLLLAEGVAGIDRVATIPEARNRGIGRAITYYPLTDARRSGYRVGTIQASEMGARLYLKMGFEVCGELTSYHWSPTVQ